MAAGVASMYGGEKARRWHSLRGGEGGAGGGGAGLCRLLNAARRPAFYLDYGVPDTFQGRFEMLALTLFPVLNRLMHEPGDDPDLARLSRRASSTTWTRYSARWASAIRQSRSA